jgi:hypothetical protein
MTTALVHPFDHLGPGPYRFAGLIDASEIAVAMSLTESIYDKPAPGSCIGSCDHCNTAITIGVQFVASNGKRFKVGETCAKKAFQPGSVPLSQAKKACNDRRTAIKNAKTSADYDRAVVWMNLKEIADCPHPKGFQGLTLADYLNWYQQNAGKKKFVDTCKTHGFI